MFVKGMKMRMMVFAAAIAYGVAGAPEGEKLGMFSQLLYYWFTIHL